MAKVKSLPARSQVKKQDTWDLTALAKSDTAWHKAFKAWEKQIDTFATFRGTLGKSSKAVKKCFDFDNKFDREGERLGSYAFLKQSEDVVNGTYQGMVQQFSFVATRAGEATSYIAPELQALPKKTLESYLKSPTLKDYRIQLNKLLRYKPHILSDKEERLLAMQGEIAGTASKVFSQLTDADFTFGHITDEKGEKIELSQGSFRMFLESPKRAVRKKAFAQFYDVFEKHENTLAAALGSSVKQDIYGSRVRNHPSAREGALFSDNVPVAVYDSLIDAVHGNLDTVYRYLELRRKKMKLKELHSYDTYVPLLADSRTTVPYAKAAKQVCEAVEPLGSAYTKALKKGLDGRWVDRYENQGKRSGAFSAGGFDGPPYILMNYQSEGLDSMFTLAHEAGHSMHTYYSARNQSYQNYQYTIFVAEVASTFNEQLLGTYLMNKARGKEAKAALINKQIDDIRGTIIRQTMFAEYEKIIHSIAEAGDPLTLECLRAEYAKLLRLYFGSDFVIDPVLELEGLRIPHFYSAFYVYKYATGLSAAIALSQMVLNGGTKERDRYLNFLKSGGSKYPLDLLRDAGVDMEKPEPVNAAMARFTSLVDELETLL
ncbi:MAG: oligoendopeptidase F [Candidatus Hydrogenedentota bacterium]